MIVGEYEILIKLIISAQNDLKPPFNTGGGSHYYEFPISLKYLNYLGKSLFFPPDCNFLSTDPKSFTSEGSTKCTFYCKPLYTICMSDRYNHDDSHSSATTKLAMPAFVEKVFPHTLNSDFGVRSKTREVSAPSIRELSDAFELEIKTLAELHTTATSLGLLSGDLTSSLLERYHCTLQELFSESASPLTPLIETLREGPHHTASSSDTIALNTFLLDTLKSQLGFSPDDGANKQQLEPTPAECWGFLELATPLLSAKGALPDFSLKFHNYDRDLQHAALRIAQSVNEILEINLTIILGRQIGVLNAEDFVKMISNPDFLQRTREASSLSALVEEITATIDSSRESGAYTSARAQEIEDTFFSGRGLLPVDKRLQDIRAFTNFVKLTKEVETWPSELATEAFKRMDEDLAHLEKHSKGKA